jgi:hypothetical protein
VMHPVEIADGDHCPARIRRHMAVPLNDLHRDFTSSGRHVQIPPPIMSIPQL